MKHLSVTQRHSGYVLLLATLFVGAIASIVLTSVLLLGTNSSLVHFSVEQGAKALAAAHACAEIALQTLRENPGYAGNQFYYPDSVETCEVLLIGGTGNTNRLLCVEGTTGNTVRRLEIVIKKIYPKIEISSWREVAAFSLCE